MQTRGIIYLYWGDKFKPDLDRSIESVKRHHPGLPFECFRLPDDATLLDKASMFALTPFDTTLFLDTDTVVLDRLDFGFEKAESFGLACCINECPWARRYADIGGDQIEYNTGVLFFTKKAAPVFREWETRAKSMDSSILFRQEGTAYLMPLNDQASFSQAIVETGFNPFVLPFNWNLRPAWQRSFFGPVKIWHCRDEVPQELRSWNDEQCLESTFIRYSGGD